MIWYVTRRNGAIVSAHSERLTNGEATEALDDTKDAALIAYLAATQAPAPRPRDVQRELDALMARLAAVESRGR